MKLAIIGSRSFDNYNLLCETLSKNKTIQEIVSGGAKGADSLAEKYANDNNICKKIFLPKFKTDKKIKYHPSYFHIRNKQIVEYSDFVLAFMEKCGSKGTISTINYAKKANKPFRIVYF